MRLLDKINQDFYVKSIEAIESPCHLVIHKKYIDELKKDCKDFLESEGEKIEEISIEHIEELLGMTLCVTLKDSNERFYFLKKT